MKVLFISTSYPVTHADTTAPFIRSIAKAVLARGHETVVLAPWRFDAPNNNPSDNDPRVMWVQYAPSTRLNVIGHGRSLANDMQLRRETYLAVPLFLAAALSTATQLAKSWHPDVIHSHWALPSGLIGALVARLASVPHVISLHGSDIFVANSNRLFGTVAGFAFRSARHIVASSPYLARQAVELGATESRSHFVPLGVDPGQFPGKPVCRRSGAPVVLAVGRLVQKKGFRLLIEQAPRFLAAHPEAQLWIAGEGDDRVALEEARSRHPTDIAARIRLLGAVAWDQMSTLMALASVVAVPSIPDARGNQDGLPTVVLEAMACGAVVVASDTGAAKNIITSGVDGVIVSTGEGPVLGDAIASLLADPAGAARMGAEAATVVRARFTWGAYAEKLEKLYES